MITYQSILSNELMSRKSKNSSYSGRSFARDLGISQSFLTLVLNKKRKLGNDRALLICEKLKLKPSQKKLFVKLVRLELARDLNCQKILQMEISELLKKHPTFALLSEDTFTIVADWYYFAILELTSLKTFISHPKWISKKLNVALSQVGSAGLKTGHFGRGDGPMVQSCGRQLMDQAALS
jgi:uncharacterized protein (TIGR02147 family)